MNSINRFFTPKKTPASAKSLAAKKEMSSGARNKKAEAGGAPSSFDTMDQAPHKEKKSAAPMPRSALKKSKPIALSEGAQLAETARKGRATAEEANHAFDQHYGAAKKADPDASPKQAKYTFNEDPVKEHIEFFRYAGEQPHIQGDVEKLYEIALKRQEPVFFIAERGRVMVWPSGHVYHGAFERDSKMPGPFGELTLPSGQKVQAWFQNGRCYRAQDGEGNAIDPQVAQVHTVYVPARIG